MSSSGAMKAATGSSDEAEAALLGDADDVQKKSAESESVPVEAEIEAKTNDDDDEKATPKKAADHQSDGPDSMAAVFDNPFYRLASMFMDPDLERSIRRVVLGVFLLTLVVMFGVGIAIIFQGEKWNNKWPSLATCGCLTAGSIYVWLLTLGISKSGENTVLDIYAVTVTMLALVGMLLAPVVVSLTITLVWKIFDEDDTSGISAAFWKWNFFFWFLSTSVAYASCISILKFAPRKIVLLADISAVMALFLIWLALTVESKNGIPVMIILAVIAAISTLAAVQIHRTNNKQNGDMPQTGTDTQDVPNDEPDDKEPASEEDDGSLLSQWTSRKATTKLSNTIDYLLLYLAPLMILFMAGIVSTLVEDCKWPILATCAALGIGSMFLKTLSVAVTKTVPKWMILLELFSLLVILPIAVGFTIGGIWYIQYHGFHFGSAAKAITTLWSYLALATYIALTCTFSNTFAKVQIVTYLSVGMTFVLGEIAILAKTTDGWVVLLLFLILDGLLIAYWKMNSQARREAHVPQDGQEMPFLAMRLNGKVNVVAEYIFLLMPLLTMFVSGIVSAFVEDCKRPILATCDSLLVGSVTIWILSRNLLYQSRNQGVTLSSVSAIGMISAVVAACLSITFSWNAHNDSEVALRKDILQPLGKSAISFWIISAATVFAGRLSLYKDTSAELRSVAYCSTVMTLFLLWISIIVETMVGWAFGVWFCVHAIISTVAVISKNGIQIQNTDEAVDEEAVGQDTETTFFVSAVFRRKNPDQQAIVNKVWRAGVLFFLLTQLIVFLAGVVTIIIDDWDGRWYTLGTCGALTVNSFFILLL